jgi:predicted dehydrogenase
MRALVIGYGSIGARHARVLNELEVATAVVTQREIQYPTAYPDFAFAMVDHRPDYIVVANPTGLHYDTLSRLTDVGFVGRVLVEKPLFDRYRVFPRTGIQSISVAYNLRFHPVIQRLRYLVRNESVLSVNAYVGQYLPEWRPRTDYRQCYSAQVDQGGGALRDLSHELDYLTWLFGDWRAVTALGGHVSHLEINSDDIFVLLMQTALCPVVSVQMSYLDRMSRRRIVVNTQRHTIEADLVGGTVLIDEKLETHNVERDYTYREMHRAALNDESGTLCTVKEGMATLELIELAEQANQRKEWIFR